MTSSRLHVDAAVAVGTAVVDRFFGVLDASVNAHLSNGVVWPPATPEWQAGAAKHIVQALLGACSTDAVTDWNYAHDAFVYAALRDALTDVLRRDVDPHFADPTTMCDGAGSGSQIAPNGGVHSMRMRIARVAAAAFATAVMADYGSISALQKNSGTTPSSSVLRHAVLQVVHELCVKQRPEASRCALLLACPLAAGAAAMPAQIGTFWFTGIVTSVSAAASHDDDGGVCNLRLAIRTVRQHTDHDSEQASSSSQVVSVCLAEALVALGFAGEDVRRAPALRPGLALQVLAVPTPTAGSFVAESVAVCLDRSEMVCVPDRRLISHPSAALDAAAEFEHVVCSFAPNIVGHDAAKAMCVLLAVADVITVDRSLSQGGRGLGFSAPLVLLQGPPRCGKSTLLHCLAAVSPTSGSVVVSAAAAPPGGTAGRNGGAAAHTTTAVADGAEQLLPRLEQHRATATSCAPVTRYCGGALMSLVAGSNVGGLLAIDDAASLSPLSLGALEDVMAAPTQAHALSCLSIPASVGGAVSGSGVAPLPSPIERAAVGDCGTHVGHLQRGGGIIVAAAPLCDAARGSTAFAGTESAVSHVTARLTAAATIVIPVPATLDEEDDAHLGSTTCKSVAAASRAFTTGSAVLSSGDRNSNGPHASLFDRLRRFEYALRDAALDDGEAEEENGDQHGTGQQYHGDNACHAAAERLSRLSVDDMRHRLAAAAVVATRSARASPPGGPPVFGVTLDAAICEFLHGEANLLPPSVRLSSLFTLVRALCYARAAFRATTSRADAFVDLASAAQPTDAEAGDVFEVCRFVFALSRSASAAQQDQHRTARASAVVNSRRDSGGSAVDELGTASGTTFSPFVAEERAGSLASALAASSYSSMLAAPDQPLPYPSLSSMTSLPHMPSRALASPQHPAHQTNCRGAAFEPIASPRRGAADLAPLLWPPSPSLAASSLSGAFADSGAAFGSASPQYHIPLPHHRSTTLATPCGAPTSKANSGRGRSSVSKKQFAADLVAQLSTLVATTGTGGPPIPVTEAAVRAVAARLPGAETHLAALPTIIERLRHDGILLRDARGGFTVHHAPSY